MEGFQSGIHHLELSLSRKCMKSSHNFRISQDESPIVGPKGHDFPGITGTCWDWPVVNCGAPFLALLDDSLADFHAEVCHLSSFKLTLCGIDSEVVVPEDSKNLGRVLPEF